MVQVKIVDNLYLEKEERQINYFLQNTKGIEIIDIKFISSGCDNCYYTAMIIYKIREDMDYTRRITPDELKAINKKK